MATSEENSFSANGIVRSEKLNNFYCSMCTRDNIFTNWESHIVNSQHIGALKQFNLVFVRNGDRVNCKACGANFVWESLKNHANWHRILPWYEPEDKDKILFDNHIMSWETWKTYYYCFPCTAIFSEWSQIFAHLADEKHRDLIESEAMLNISFNLDDTTISYKVLISEGFEPCSASKVKCTICDYSNIEFQKINEHIKSTDHSSAKLQLMRHLEMQENELAVQKQVEERLKKAISKQTENNEQTNTTGCVQKYPNNQNNMPDVPNEAQKKMHDWNWKLRKNVNNGFNGITHNRQMNNSGDLSRTLNGQNNTRKPGFPGSSNNFPVQQKGSERYCTMCECIVCTSVEDHLVEDKHLSILRHHGYEHVVPKDGTKFDCKSCNCVIPNLENVFRHIKGQRHMNLLFGQKNMTNRYDTPRGKTISFKMNFPKPANNYKQFSAASLPSDYIVELNLNDLFCRICDCVIYGHGNASDHLNKKIHADAVEQFCATIRTNGINNYYCRRCNCEILGRDNLYLHIHGEQHAKSGLVHKQSPVNNTIVVKDTKVSENGEFTTSNSDSTVEISKQSENASKTIQNYEFIVKLNKTDFCCKICHLVLFDQTNIAEHVAGQRHIAASKGYNCNDPSSNDNVKYFCNSCRCNIPNFANVYLHAIGGRHKNSLNLPTNSTLTLPTRSQRGTNWEILAREFIGQVSDTDYNCRICNVPLSGQSSVDDHIADKSHIATMKKYGCEKIPYITGNKYHCTWCDCIIPSLDNIYVHVAGRRHLQTVLDTPVVRGQNSENQHTMPMTKNAVDETKIPKLLELKISPPCPMQGKRNVEESKKLENDEINPKERQADAREQILDSNSVANTITPQFCSTVTLREAIERNRMARSTTNSVIHPSQNDFLTDRTNISSKNSDNGLSLNDSPHHSNINSHSSGTELTKAKPFNLSNETISTLNDNGESFRSVASSMLSLNEIGKGGRKRRAPKIPSTPKNMQILDINNDYIYEMKDKLREIERGMKLCLRTETNNIYCLICRKKTTNTLHNYCEHLWSLEHCEFLEGMEKDHALFEIVPGQLSELDLASHYMEETSEDTILCHVCDEEMENIDHQLLDHTNHRGHVEKCDEMRLKASAHFETMKSRILCDWYKIFKYSCIPCSMNFDCELTFAKHLKSTGHANIVKQPENVEQRLIYDFCAPCALLWYGFRCTFVNHCEIPTHKWLIRDENYLSPQLSPSAKCLLSMPEEYIRDTTKYFDEISEKAREKEETVIRDIEKLAKCKFRDAKAYTFGWRVFGLNSLDDDIEIFLNCGNMYDGTGSSQDQISYIKTIVSDALSKDSQSWDMEELLAQCRSSTVKARHRATGLACEIHFENGLDVENTKLIKAYNDAFPSFGKMIIFLKQWLVLCDLPASEFMTINALCWFVIFYLQHESIVPTITELIEVKEESHIIAGWEVGASHNFICSERADPLTIEELLIRFFTFCTNFDYRYNVACPLIGEEVKKRMFAYPQRLPKQMKPYIDYLKNSNNPEPFKYDSVMCIQDPFCLQKNLTEAVSKVNLNRFRTYCFKSLDVLDTPSTQ